MVPFATSLLIAIASTALEPASATNGMAFNIGMAVSVFPAANSREEVDGVFGFPLEFSVLQHNERVWMGAGLSWQFGTSAFAVGSRTVNANILGFHGDLGVSLFASDHVDLKVGIGPALRYVSVYRGVWHTGSYDSPGGDRIPASRQHRFLAGARATTSLLFHPKGRSGGLELIPLRIEYGPSMIQVSPCIAVSKFF